MVSTGSNNVPNTLRIIAKEEGMLELDNLSSFLYDLVLLHDRLLLTLSKEYDYRYYSSLYFYRRTGRPIEKSDKLLVKFITKESPFDIILIIAAAATVAGLAWTLTKIIEKLRDWNDDKEIKRLNKAIKREELRKIIMENLESRLSQEYPVDIEMIINRIVRDALRLGDNEQLRIDKIEILETTDDQHRQ